MMTMPNKLILEIKSRMGISPNFSHLYFQEGREDDPVHS